MAGGRRRPVVAADTSLVRARLSPASSFPHAFNCPLSLLSSACLFTSANRVTEKTDETRHESGSVSSQAVVTEAPDDARLLLVGHVLVADDGTPHPHAVLDFANDLTYLMALTFKLEALEAAACLVNNLKHRFPTLICNRWRKADQDETRKTRATSHQTYRQLIPFLLVPAVLPPTHGSLWS